MGQDDFLREFDAEALDDFIGAGLADRASYFAPDAEPDAIPIRCTVLVDRDMARVTGQASGSNVTALISLFHAEVTARYNGVVQVDGSGDRWKLVRLFDRDGSRSRFEAQYA